MKRDLMNQQIGEEMERIPRGGKLSPQNMLRYAYRRIRVRSLSEGVIGTYTRGDILRRAVEAVKKTHPNAELKFDADFFSQ
jgi:hypothetical protein